MLNCGCFKLLRLMGRYNCVSSTLLAPLAASQWIQYPELMMFVHSAEITSHWFNRVLVLPLNRLPWERRGGDQPQSPLRPSSWWEKGSKSEMTVLRYDCLSRADDSLKEPDFRPVSPRIMIINNKNQVEKLFHSVVSAIMCKHCLQSGRQTAQNEHRIC